MKKVAARIFHNILLLFLVIFVLAGCAVYITDTHDNMEPDDKAYVHKLAYLEKELVDGYGTHYIGNFEVNEAIFNGYGYYFEWDNEDLDYLSTFVTNGIVSWVPEHDANFPVEGDRDLNNGQYIDVRYNGDWSKPELMPHSVNISLKNLEQDVFEENGVDIFYYSLELEIEVIDQNNNVVDGRTHLFLWNPDSNSNVMLFPYDHILDRNVGSSINHTQDGIINYELSFYLVEDNLEMVSPVTVDFYSGLEVFTTEDIHLIPVWLDDNRIIMTNNCDNTVTINWPEATGLGLEEYRIYINDLYHGSVDANTLSYGIEGLEDNTEYHITVEAVTPFGENQITNSVTTTSTKLEIGVTTAVCAGKTMQISDSQNYIVLPNDLPEGTTLMVSLGEDIEDGTLEAVGAIYRYTLILPEGNDEYQGEFTLEYTYTLKSDDHSDKIGFYYFNENNGSWEHRGGEFDAETNTAQLKTNNFSTYGLFVDFTGPQQIILSVDQATQSSIVLSFSAIDPSGIKEFHIYRDGILLDVIDGSLNIYEDVGLKANTVYTYYIVAVDNMENLSTSQEVIASTLAVIDDQSGQEPTAPPTLEQPSVEPPIKVQVPSPEEEELGTILPKTANNSFNIMLVGSLLIIISATLFIYYSRKVRIS